jgi:hypothetical protein
MFLIRKSTGECDGNEWCVGFAQQARRPFYAQAHEILVRCDAERGPELAREVTRTQPTRTRNGRKVN